MCATPSMSRWNGAMNRARQRTAFRTQFKSIYDRSSAFTLHRALCIPKPSYHPPIAAPNLSGSARKSPLERGDLIVGSQKFTTN